MNPVVGGTWGIAALVVVIAITAAFDLPLAAAVVVLALAAAAAVRRPLAGVVLAGALVSLVPTYWAPDLPGTSVALSPAVVACVVLIPAALRNLQNFRVVVADKIVLAFVAIEAVAFAANAQGFVGSIASTVLGVALPYAIFRLVCLRKGAPEALALGVVVGGVVSAYIAVREYRGWPNPFFELFTTGHQHAFWARADTRLGHVRPEAAFGHAIALGMFLALAALLAIALAWRSDARKLRTVLLYASALLIVFGLFENLVRGPLVMLGVGLLLFVVLEYRGIGSGRAIALVIGVIVAVNVGSFANVLELRDASLEPGRVQESGEYRFEIWRVVTDSANFSLLGREAADDSESEVGFAKAVGQQVGIKSFDNFYAKIYIHFGVLALITFALLGIFTARVAFIGQLSVVERAWAAGLLAAFINLMTVDLLTQVSDIFWMGLGMLAAVRQSHVTVPERVTPPLTDAALTS